MSRAKLSQHKLAENSQMNVINICLISFYVLLTATKKGGQEIKLKLAGMAKFFPKYENREFPQTHN